MKKSDNVKGSLTIEAAFVMPLIITVVIWLIFMAYYLHDKSIMSRHTYITALRTSQVLTGDHDMTEEINKNLELLAKERLLGNWDIKKTVKQEEHKIVVMYDAEMKIPDGTLSILMNPGASWNIHVSSIAYKVDEVRTIRERRKHK